MNARSLENLRSVALVGHGGSGKTSLAEALLQACGVIQNKGRVEKGNTVCDFDAQEKEAGHSLFSALAHFSYEDTQVQLLDTPGYPDFAGQAIPALAAADTALVVINAQTGIELMTERMMRWSEERGLCRMIVINKIDADNLDLPDLVAEIRETFGPQCLLLDLPSHGAAEVVEVLERDSGDADFASVAAAHRALIDQVVEEDENLLARYLEDGVDPTPAELHDAFEKAMRDGHLVPILFVSAKTGAGIRELLHVLASLAPNPSESNPPSFYKGEPGADSMPFPARPDPTQHVLAHVFKVVIDPYLGKVGVFRVHQGSVRKDMQLYVGDAKKAFKVTHLYRLQGKDTEEVSELLPGEIGAVTKVEEVFFDCVLHDSHEEDHIHLQALAFPKPMAGLAVETKKRGDEQRLFEILARLAMEDPTFEVERHPSHHETVIRGLGEIHLKSKLARMAGQYKLELETRPPRIPYRETISQAAEAQYRHKKQSGGAGQFGEVHLRIEPLERGAGFRFVDAVKGGVIPGVFMPAVEKGVRQALADGVIAGCPVEDLQVTVYDGKTHAVDGKEVAFTIAGRKAVIEAIRNARPVVLEPIVSIDILAPETAMGDLAGDISGRRGHVLGTDIRGRGQVVLKAEVPLAEISDYAARLKSLTGGQGSYAIEFQRYAVVPPNIQQQLSSQFKLREDDE